MIRALRGPAGAVVTKLVADGFCSRSTAYKYAPPTVRVGKRKTDLCSSCEDLMNLRYHACDYWKKLREEYSALEVDRFAPPTLPEGEGQRAIRPAGDQVIDMMRASLYGSGEEAPAAFRENDRQRLSEIIDLADSLRFHESVAEAQRQAYKESVQNATKRGSRKIVARFDFAGAIELREERERKNKWGKSTKASALSFYVRTDLLNGGAPTYVDVLSGCVLHSSEHAAAQVLLMIEVLRKEADLRTGDELELW